MYCAYCQRDRRSAGAAALCAAMGGSGGSLAAANTYSTVVIQSGSTVVIQSGGEIARDHGAQHGAKVRGALGAEATFEAGLRLLPSLAAGEEALFARFGQMQLLGAAVGRGCFDFDQAIALERKNVAADRSPVHDHFLGQGVDGHWAEPFQLCQN